MKKDNTKILIMDGAMGTELIRHGLELPLPMWSGDANLTHPGTIYQIHKENIDAGADILTTNTFRTTPRTYSKSGLSNTDSINKAFDSLNTAVALAKRASGNEALIAGSIAPLEDCYSPELFPGSPAAKNEFTQLSEWLFSAGVDIILYETMGCLEEIKAATFAVRSINIPCWVSIILKDKDHLLDGSDLKDVIEYLSNNDVDKILINCTLITILNDAIELILETWAGSWGVYPNTGVTMPSKDGNIKEMIPDNDFSISIKNYIGLGASVVGACCGSTAKTIQLIKNISKD